MLHSAQSNFVSEYLREIETKKYCRVLNRGLGAVG
jgi:hypothetical protein